MSTVAYFGLEYNDAGKLIVSEGDRGTGLKTYVARNLGILAQEKKLVRYQNALADPVKFLKEKREDISGRVLTESAKVFESELIRLINNGMSESKARKAALEEARKRQEREMKIHDQMFPTELQKLAQAKLKKPADN